MHKLILFIFLLTSLSLRTYANCAISLKAIFKHSHSTTSILKKLSSLPVYSNPGRILAAGTDVYLVTLIDGTKAVFKPNTPGIVRSNYQMEIAAYELSEALDINFVPPTVERNLFGKQGSLQLFIEDATQPDWTPRTEVAPIEILKIFDYLIANPDRFGSNFIRTSNNRYYAIDNGGAFMIEHPEPVEDFSFLLPIKSTSPEVITLFKRIKNFDMEKLNDFMNYLDFDQQINFYERLHRLQNFL